jgi:hypothetical protein
MIIRCFLARSLMLIAPSDAVTSGATSAETRAIDRVSTNARRADIDF